jgi:hypothetical protein
MSLRFGCWLLLAGWAGCLQAQTFPVLRWSRFFDNRGEDYPAAMVRTADGLLVLGGVTHLAENGETNIWLVKTGPDGALRWEQEISVSGCEELYALAPDAAGGVLFAGVANSLLSESELGAETYGAQAFAGQLDREGRILWMQGYGGSSLDLFSAAAPDSAGSWLLAGHSHSRDGQTGGNQGQSDCWIFGAAPRGQPRFSRVIGGRGAEQTAALIRSAGGGYVLAGQSEPLNGPAQAFLMRISQQGYPAWDRSYPRASASRISALAEAPDGRLLAAGEVEEGGRRGSWWMRLTAEGKLIYEQRLAGPGSSWLACAAACGPRGYIAGGAAATAAGSGKGGLDAFLLRLDLKGSVIWQSRYGGPADESCTAVLEYAPGTLIALGPKRNTFGAQASGNADYWMLRVDELPADSIRASIFVRAAENRIDRRTPTRFRAQCAYGERFHWDFGDGTSSAERNPIKSYDYPGMYDVTLTVFVNETASQTVVLPRPLEVW